MSLQMGSPCRRRLPPVIQEGWTAQSSNAAPLLDVHELATRLPPVPSCLAADFETVADFLHELVEECKAAQRTSGKKLADFVRWGLRRAGRRPPASVG